MVSTIPGTTANADDLHVERLSPPRYASADFPQPDNQQSAAIEHQPLYAVPIERKRSPFDHRSMFHDQSFGAPEQQRHCMFNDGSAVCAAQVRHPNTPASESGKIELIASRMEPRNQFQLVRDLENTGRQDPSHDDIGITNFIGQ